MHNFDFDYFLRLDDDYFICMDRFIDEVPMPPKSYYHWGWIHCVEDIVRVEESIILLSRDIVETFIGQDSNKMLCHRWTGQMIGIWKQELMLKTFYHHDQGLHHHPPAEQLVSFWKEQNICSKYVAVHGAYPSMMRILWKNRGPNNYPSGKSLIDYASKCDFPDDVLMLQKLSKTWQAVPKLCKDNPDWGEDRGKTYLGRQGA